MELEKNTGFIDYVRKWFTSFAEWMKPTPSDKPLLQVLKLAYKSVVLLVLIALSPVILTVLLFVFFAAV